MTTFPATRLRRLRRTSRLRSLVRETRLDLGDFVMPLFVCPGEGVVHPLEGLPGIGQRSVDALVDEAETLVALGVSAVLLFGIPEEKDEEGSGAYDEDGIVQRALLELRARFPELVLATDVCLCEYTSHGHCGILEGEDILNDVTVAHVAEAALSHAVAGVDFVAPSDMMDGRVAAIRTLLDERGLERVGIMSYAAKYCSAFYGPFRDAADSAPQFGDRRSYQLDVRNRSDALASSRRCAIRAGRLPVQRGDYEPSARGSQSRATRSRCRSGSRCRLHGSGRVRAPPGCAVRGGNRAVRGRRVSGMRDSR